MTAETDAREVARPFWEVGARLGRARTDRQLSQGELALLLDVSQPTLSHWERGRRLPSPEALQMLARDGVDIGWVLTGTASTPVPSGDGREAFDALCVLAEQHGEALNHQHGDYHAYSQIICSTGRSPLKNLPHRPTQDPDRPAGARPGRPGAAVRRCRLRCRRARSSPSRDGDRQRPVALPGSCHPQ